MLALLGDPGFLPADVVARLHPPFVRRLQDGFQVSLGSLCDMRCGYCCATGDGPGTAIPLAAALDEVARGLASGKRFPLLMGGEPLVYPDLWPLLAGLAARGIREFGLLTNGTRLVDAAAARRLVDAGCVLAILSFDDFDPVRLGRMVRRPEHHPVVLAALRSLLGQLDHTHLVLQVCVSKINFDHLPELPRFVAEQADRAGADRGRITLNLNNLQINGRARDHADELVADLRLVAPRVREAVAAADALGLHVLVRDFPMCTLDPALETRNSSFIFKDYAFDQGRQVDWFATLSTKKPSCARCRYDRVCSGFFPLYAGMYSDEIFRPVEDRRTGPAAPPAAEPAAPPAARPAASPPVGTASAPPTAAPATTARRPRRAAARTGGRSRSR